MLCMIHDMIFNSKEHPEGEMIHLACGYVSLNEIKFINENIIVNMESRTGEVTFFDLQKNKLLSTGVKTPQSGDEKFSEVKCSVEGEQIKLGFPEYDYEDNYPHCDGEHDRWTKIISGFSFLCYDFKNNCIIECFHF